MAFDITEEWSDVNLEIGGNAVTRPSFANAVAGERAPLLDLSLNPYEQPACSDNKDVPNKAKKSEYSHTYGCLTHQDADGNPCPHAEKYQINVASGKWDVFHNGSEHFEVASGKHVGVPLHFREEISQHASANRGQPMLALHAVVGDHWDGSEADRASYPSMQQVRNFVKRQRCPGS
eukprot:gene30793-38580_t